MSINKLVPIPQLLSEKLGIAQDNFDSYGDSKAKLKYSFATQLATRSASHLVLVTGINPTPAGDGKTTTLIGLTDALNLIGKKTIACLREPSIGPCLGIKGGGTGAGLSKIEPSDDINFHFNGDIHAISCAHNYLSSLIDNALYHKTLKHIDPRNILWPRTIDLNDRALRDLIVSTGKNGYTRKESFIATAASEIMAILCLSSSIEELQDRLSKIAIAIDSNNDFIFASDIKETIMLSKILENAFLPNVVQTLENNIVFVHGGPFANIAHGCNSVFATKTALSLSDFTITEAGFGADLGAEKFLNIKSPNLGRAPSACVLVCALQSIKHHSKAKHDTCNTELNNGLELLLHHYSIIKNMYGINCVVAINKFKADDESEIQWLAQKLKELSIPVSVTNNCEQGGSGAIELANLVVENAVHNDVKTSYVYQTSDTIKAKITKIAQKVYLASNVTFNNNALSKIKHYESKGLSKLPICIAKTPYSLTTDKFSQGIVKNHSVEVTDLNLASGAGFITIYCGNIITMPGLPVFSRHIN